MNSPEDDLEVDPEEILIREQIALVDAQAKVAFHEYSLARLAKEHPEAAARVPSVEAETVADLRTGELNKAVRRINVALGLGLTGDEEDYWLRLWAWARASLGIGEDELEGITREKLVELIEAGLPGVSPVVEPFASSAEPANVHDGTVGNSVLAAPTVPKQDRKSNVRSRSPHAETLYASVRQMKAEGLSQLHMCERLDAQKKRRPDLVGWRDLTWRAAYLSPKHGRAVKKWLSKVTSVTS